MPVTSDDFASDATTTGLLGINSYSYGTINFLGDRDWFKIYLQRGITYQFDQFQTPINQTTNLDSFIRLHYSDGSQVPNASNDDSGGYRNAQLLFTPSFSGYYYLSAEANYYTYLGQLTGTYGLLAREVNHAPEVQDMQQNIRVGQSIPAASLFKVSDQEGDAVITYAIYEPTGVGYVTWSNNAGISFNESTRVITVPAAGLGSVNYIAQAVGTDALQVSAYDGALWSDWTPTPITVSPAFAPFFRDVRITHRIDQDGDEYAARFDLEVDVDSNSASQFYVKVLEHDLLKDDFLLFSKMFDVDGAVVDYRAIPINASSFPGVDLLSHGTAEFTVQLFDGLTGQLVQTWRTSDDTSLGNVQVELGAQDVPDLISQRDNNVVVNQGKFVEVGALFSILSYGDRSLRSGTFSGSHKAEEYTSFTDEGFNDRYRAFFDENPQLGYQWELLADRTSAKGNWITQWESASTSLSAGMKVNFTQGGLYNGYVGGYETSTRDEQFLPKSKYLDYVTHTPDNGATLDDYDFSQDWLGDANALIAQTFDSQGTGTLVIAFRGTDKFDGAFADEQTYSGDGVYFHYEAFRPLIEAAYAYASDANNRIGHIVVSGHSLGAAMADVFTLVDARRFAAIAASDLTIVSIASPGVVPDAIASSDALFGFADRFDSSLASVVTNSLGFDPQLTLRAQAGFSNFYFGFTHDQDRVYFAEKDELDLLKPEEVGPLGTVNLLEFASNSTIDENENWGAIILNRPTIENSDVTYKDIYDPLGPFAIHGFGADHNGQIYWRDIQALYNSTLSPLLNGQNLIFGRGQYSNDQGEWFKPAVSFTPEGGQPDPKHDQGPLGLVGTDAADFIFGLEGDDVLIGQNGEDLLDGGPGNDRLTGQNGEDKLEGGPGNDTMTGGAGSDTYWVDSSGDLVTETDADPLTGGRDLVLSLLASYTLPAHVEDMQLLPGAVSAVGNALDNRLTGNAGTINYLNGGAGSDYMAGGDGNDIYYVDASTDVVSETNPLAAGGTDTVVSTLTYSAGPNIENIVLSGLASSTGVGNSLANYIEGNAAQNYLFGGAGTDTLKGNDGNDIYYIDASTDVVIETNALAAGGTDTVVSSVTFTLGANLEQLLLSGNAAITGIGNATANYIEGNSAQNYLSGGVGSDTLKGNDGNDIYYVDVSTDVVIETNANPLTGGVDFVVSTVTYQLGANVENLLLDGSAPITGIGSAVNNYIEGNNAANFLSGGLGADTMKGNGGNDVYYVDNTGDVVIETNAVLATGGRDTVSSSIAYSLGANVEDLLLSGVAGIGGLGNGLSNHITGNTAANALSGQDGNDTLVGGTGTDTLTGGLGADTFDFNTLLDSLVGASRDLITDFSSAQGDRVDLAGIDANTLLANDQAFSFIGAATFSLVAGQLRFASNILAGDTDGNGVADLEIQLTGVATLAVADLLL